MKKIIPLICFFLLQTGLAFPQTRSASVEKSLWGVQTGFLGGWVHNESSLGKKGALRSEIGLDAGLWGGDFYDRTGFLLTPVISIEPKLYYNIYKRAGQRKSIGKNSGNFITVKISYHPDWFIISNHYCPVKNIFSRL